MLPAYPIAHKFVIPPSTQESGGAASKLIFGGLMWSRTHILSALSLAIPTRWLLSPSLSLTVSWATPLPDDYSWPFPFAAPEPAPVSLPKADWPQEISASGFAPLTGLRLPLPEGYVI